MLLLADSGSTKTDWVVVDDFGETRRFQSSGINPFFRTTADIAAELKEVFHGEHLPLEHIYFYGAGVVNEEKADVVLEALQIQFGDCAIDVAGDMLGAARAVCGRRAGIVCILGTGSNASYYDGEEVGRGIPPMGYILGDEGSGAVIGKQLLGDYFKGVMPADLREKFYATFQVEKDAVLEAVYRGERPNQYLASFAHFLTDEAESDYCINLVRTQFKAFVQRNVAQLPEAKDLTVNFVGSVAFHFQTILVEELNKEGLIAGRIIKEPIEGLLAYHQIKAE